MDKTAVSTNQAPQAIGPYSQAVKAGGFVFCSGQIALDPETGALTGGSVAEQTRRVLENLEAVLIAAGLTFDDVVKTTVFLADMNDFGEMNAVYSKFFRTTPPARAAVEVARLPKDEAVEIDAIATAR